LLNFLFVFYYFIIFIVLYYFILCFFFFIFLYYYFIFILVFLLLLFYFSMRSPSRLTRGLRGGGGAFWSDHVFVGVANRLSPRKRRFLSGRAQLLVRMLCRNLRSELAFSADGPSQGRSPLCCIPCRKCPPAALLLKCENAIMLGLPLFPSSQETSGLLIYCSDSIPGKCNPPSNAQISNPLRSDSVRDLATVRSLVSHCYF